MVVCIIGLVLQLWLSTESKGRIGKITLLATELLFVCCVMLIFLDDTGIIGTLLCLKKYVRLCPGCAAAILLTVLLAVLLITAPIFPVCHSLAKGQYCLCLTNFLKVRLTLGPQGSAAWGRPCQ